MLVKFSINASYIFLIKNIAYWPQLRKYLFLIFLIFFVTTEHYNIFFNETENILYLFLKLTYLFFTFGFLNYGNKVLISFQKIVYKIENYYFFVDPTNHNKKIRIDSDEFKKICQNNFYYKKSLKNLKKSNDNLKKRLEKYEKVDLNLLEYYSLLDDNSDNQNVTNEKEKNILFVNPQNYEEAMASPWAEMWKEVCEDEINSFYAKEVIEEVSDDENLDIHRSFWHFENNFSIQNSIDCFDVNLIIEEKKQGHCLSLLYAPTIDIISLYLCINLFEQIKFKIYQIKITACDIYNDVKTNIFIRPPPPFSKQNVVWKLKKAPFGLKQSCWFKKLIQILEQINFKSTLGEQSLFIRKNNKKAYIIVHYNNFLIAAENNEECENIIKEIEKLKIKIKIKHTSITKFMGVNFTKNKKNFIYADQSKTIDELYYKFFKNNENLPKNLPSDEMFQEALRQTEKNKLINNDEIKQLYYELYKIASKTRPDILVSMSFIVKHLNNPTQKLFDIAKLILKYLKKTKEEKLILGARQNDSSFKVYADASILSWGQKLSRTGILFKLFGCTIGCFCEIQKRIATTSLEAEYTAMHSAAKKTRTIQNLLYELDWSLDLPTIMFCDNQSAMAIATEETSGLQHLDLIIQSLKHNYKNFIKFESIETSNQLADGLTKLKVKFPHKEAIFGDIKILEQKVF